MNRLTAAIFRELINTARPWSLLAGVLLYALGGGIARYLGAAIDWPAYWLGQTAVTMLQLSAFLLSEYFDRAGQPAFDLPRPPRRMEPPPDGMREHAEQQAEVESVETPAPRVVFFQAAAATLTIGAVMTVLLIAENKLNPPAFLFLALAFALAISYAVPPLRLVTSGYGELIMAILVANLFPALAFLLQEGSLHRLLAMLTFPLTLLFLAALLARSLQRYMQDIRQERQTMLVRVGWQRGMTLHNALIALAYLVLAVSLIAGLPFRLVLPMLLSLPVAVFEIYQMNAIAAGGKPHWRMLAYTALALVGFAAYFINLALWIG